MASSMATLAAMLQNVQLPPSQLAPIILPTPPSLVGALASNDYLAQATKIADNLVTGPESMVVRNGYVYTGLQDGWVVEITPIGEVRKILRLAYPECRSGGNERICGRPLGIRADSQDYLVVVDTYKGIFKINPRNGRYKQLVDANTSVNGSRLGFINDLVITRSGVVFFTSSSSRFDRNQFLNVILEGDNTGRLLVYNPWAAPEEQVKELVTNLYFPNGLELSQDEDYLLLAEGARAKIYRIWIGQNTGKQGTIEVFAENLPGLVDNVRRSPRGTYWVGLSSFRSKEEPGVLDEFGKNPRAREYILSLPHNQIMSNNAKRGIVVELNDQGQIIRSIQDPMGRLFSSVSEVEEENGTLYFGSFDSPYVGRLELTQLPPPIDPRTVTTPAPTTTTPATTTTPVPTVAPSSNNLVNLLNQVRINASKFSKEVLEQIVVILVRRLVETKVEALRAIERSNRLQQALNAAVTASPRADTGRFVTAALDSSSTTA